ncbi:hypothetical protein IFM89_037513 [Coptis chinensis]|uniref:CCHC-type domain-containing protein n=1 Tax=Coptis chinensis TaxID=261450 RepID=A0A835MGQ5_9MAGN|nr:hypothetical protein IFM89_037513 [Coptis chinensis]
MGGGYKSNSNCIPIYKDCSCLLCGQKTHKIAQCPWMHVICKNCNNECDLLEDNNKKRFIKCQKCELAQWLDDLMGNSSDKPNDLGTPPAAVKKGPGCFVCKAEEHWSYTCPWKWSPCKMCTTIRDVRTSTQLRSKGEKFLKCPRCDEFEWLEVAIAGCKKEKSEPKKLVFEEKAKESSTSKSNSNLKLNIDRVSHTRFI